MIAFGVRAPTQYRGDYVGDVGALLASSRSVDPQVWERQWAAGHELGITWAPVFPWPADDPVSLANLEVVVSDLEADPGLLPMHDWDEQDGWVFVRVIDSRGTVSPLANYAMAVRRALANQHALVPEAVCETVNAQREVMADLRSAP